MGFDTWKGKSSLLFFKFYLATFDLLFIYMGFNFVFFLTTWKFLLVFEWNYAELIDSFG